MNGTNYRISNTFYKTSVLDKGPKDWMRDENLTIPESPFPEFYDTRSKSCRVFGTRAASIINIIVTKITIVISHRHRCNIL